MGKGNRNSQQRLDEKLAIEEKRLAREKARKSKKTSDRWIAITCILLVVLIVGILVINVLDSSGVFLRATSVVTIGDGQDIVVNSTMMTYFVSDYMNNWYNNYYVYIAYGLINSINFSYDLSTQVISKNDAGYLGDATLAEKKVTWQEYFMDGVIEDVRVYVTYAYFGRNIEECQLKDEDYATIDESVASLKESLKTSGSSFAEAYGKGVSEKDVRDCLELVQRASKYGEYLQDKTEAALKADDADVKKYPEDNKSNFYSAKYLSYTITVKEKTEGGEEAYDKAVEAATKALNKIKENAKTPEDFVTLVEAYKKSPSSFIKDEGATTKATEEKETEKSTEKATETVTEKETTIEELIDKYTGTISWETGDKGLGDWIFGTEPAKEGDIMIETETSTETETETKKVTSSSKAAESETESSSEKETSKDKSYDVTTLTIYMLKDEPDLDHKVTHNIAYLISDNKVAAEKFLEAFNANKTHSREEFVRIAEEHYDALHASHDHSDENTVEPTFSFASVDSAKVKYFSDNYNAINLWIEDEARVEGEYTNTVDKIIKIDVTNSDKSVTTYYAIVLFEKHDVEAWYADAFAGATQKRIDDWYENAIKEFPITIDMDALEDIM